MNKHFIEMNMQPVTKRWELLRIAGGNRFTFLLLPGLFICVATMKGNAQKRNRMDDWPTIKKALDKKVFMSDKSYYQLTKSTDSTVHLFWGNSSIKRRLDNDLDLWPAAERLFVKWSNRNYLILEYWTGSGVWTDLVLPMNQPEKPQEFSNGLCFDSTYSLLGVEQSGDTILFVENLKTRKKQFIVDRVHVCDGVYNSSCIDTIAIKNKMLFLKWVTPDNHSDKSKTYKRTIRLQL